MSKKPISTEDLKRAEEFRDSLVERLKSSQEDQAPYSEKQKETLRSWCQILKEAVMIIDVPAGAEKAGKKYAASARTDDDWRRFLRDCLMAESKATFYLLSTEEQEKKLNEAFHSPKLQNQRFRIDAVTEAGGKLRFQHYRSWAIDLFEFDKQIEAKRKELEGADFKRAGQSAPKSEKSARQPEAGTDRTGNS